MLQAFAELAAPLQALLAGLATLALTGAGATLVIFGRLGRGPTFEAMLGFAAGVMLAASYWSLLDPAIAVAEAQGRPPWVPATVGLLAGGAFLLAADRLVPHLHPSLPRASAEGPQTRWSTATLLVLAITLHNIPEGLAVGVAFGAAGAPTGAMLPGPPTFGAAVALAVGIGLQNLPEGAAVALPLHGAGAGKWRSFLAGTASAGVEPVAAVVGALAVESIAGILPYALGFAAGAMIYVVLEELIPSAHRSGRADLTTVAALVGFSVMMVLDVGLG